MKWQDHKSQSHYKVDLGIPNDSGGPLGSIAPDLIVPRRKGPLKPTSRGLLPSFVKTPGGDPNIFNRNDFPSGEEDREDARERRAFRSRRAYRERYGRRD